MNEKPCICPRIDGSVIVGRHCLHHPEARAKQAVAREQQATVARDFDAEDSACAWSDYRKDYGVNAKSLSVAHKAFLAGWQAARAGDQSGALR